MFRNYYFRAKYDFKNVENNNDVFILLCCRHFLASAAALACSAALLSKSSKAKDYQTDFLSKGQEVETTQGIDIEFNCIFILSTFR